MKKTFKEFLAEVDAGDLYLQQQHQQKQNQAAERTRGQSDFKAKLGDQPNRGDVVILKANKYIVLGGNKEGVMVKGAGGTTVIPHGTKFKNVGVSPNTGKTIFKALIQ